MTYLRVVLIWEYLISRIIYLRFWPIQDLDNFKIFCCFHIVMNGACLFHKQGSLIISRAKMCKKQLIGLCLFCYRCGFSRSRMPVLNSLFLLVLAVCGFKDQDIAFFEKSDKLVCRSCIS